MHYLKKGQHLYFAFIVTLSLDGNPFFSCLKKVQVNLGILTEFFFLIPLLEICFTLCSLGPGVPFCIRYMFVKYISMFLLLIAT